MEHLDEILGMFLPIIVYWSYSGFCEFIGSLDRFQKYKIHSPWEEKTKNSISKRQVVKGVLLAQAIQALLVLLAYLVYSRNGTAKKNESSSLLVLACQFIVATLVFDTYSYFIHRLEHSNKFLYRHFHSQHHRLVVPWSFGSQYANPIEGIFTDTAAGILAFLVSGMSHRASAVFYTIVTIRGIDIHTAMRLPWNPFHLLFWNNAAFHDFHHQLYGHKYNFSQPFFVMWDKICGTYMPCHLEEKKDGGYEARPAIN